MLIISTAESAPYPNGFLERVKIKRRAISLCRALGSEACDLTVQMTRYTVIDVEMTGLESASGMLQAEVTLARVADFGVNDVRVTSLTHMGALLSAGDTVCGWDIPT